MASQEGRRGFLLCGLRVSGSGLLGFRVLGLVGFRVRAVRV